jgi:hypothetical protein
VGKDGRTIDHKIVGSSHNLKEVTARLDNANSVSDDLLDIESTGLDINSTLRSVDLRNTASSKKVVDVSENLSDITVDSIETLLVLDMFNHTSEDRGELDGFTNTAHHVAQVEELNFFSGELEGEGLIDLTVDAGIIEVVDDVREDSNEVSNSRSVSNVVEDGEDSIGEVKDILNTVLNLRGVESMASAFFRNGLSNRDKVNNIGFNSIPVAGSEISVETVDGREDTEDGDVALGGRGDSEGDEEGKNGLVHFFYF